MLFHFIWFASQGSNNCVIYLLPLYFITDMKVNLAIWNCHLNCLFSLWNNSWEKSKNQNHKFKLSWNQVDWAFIVSILIQLPTIHWSLNYSTYHLYTINSHIFPILTPLHLCILISHLTLHLSPLHLYTLNLPLILSHYTSILSQCTYTLNLHSTLHLPWLPPYIQPSY